MKKILIPFILVLVVLSGCTQIPFSFNIPSTDQYVVDTNQYLEGTIPVLFKDITFDQLQDIDSQLDRVIIDYLKIDLEAQATGTIQGEVEITVYASTTEITINDISDDTLGVASSTFTQSDTVANLTLDSSTSPAFSKIIDYINNGGRVFHIAVLVKNTLSSIDEIGIRITGGLIKGKFVIIQ